MYHENHGGDRQRQRKGFCAGQSRQAAVVPGCYRPRHYHPGLGTFITRDSVGRADESLYAYVGGRPASSLDPSGLTEISGWHAIQTATRFPKDPRAGQNQISTRVSVVPWETKWFAFLTINAQVKAGKDPIGFQLGHTLDNRMGSKEYPGFMAVFLESRMWIDGIEQPRRLQHNVRRDYPGFTGNKRIKVDPDTGRMLRDPVTRKWLKLDKVIANWEFMNFGADEAGTAVFLDGLIVPPCKSARGKATLWYWYSDVLWENQRRTVFGTDTAKLRALPALVVGYDIEWSFKAGNAGPGGFDRITIKKKSGPVIYGEDAITGATGINFYNIVEKVTGYGGFRKPPDIKGNVRMRP